jgi:hypothetical protein
VKIRSIQFIFEQRWLQGVYTHVGHVCEGALEYTKHAQTPNTHTLSFSCINEFVFVLVNTRVKHTLFPPCVEGQSGPSPIPPQSIHRP